MAKKRLKRGLFITFEGPEGCGKSTHSKLVAYFLKKQGFDVLYTREPGGTDLGDKIRRILLDSKKLDISPIGELFLFEASRSELVKEVIKPALSKKKIIISDRFNDATHVYQGYAGNVPLRDIEKVESVSMRGVKPDLTLILDIEAKKGLKKISSKKKDRIESKKLSFHRKVRKGYLALARKHKKRIKVVKTKSTIGATFIAVKKEVMNVVWRYQRAG